ncbi:WD40 repeat-like protein [Crassisporium funariophilum]|nr:WD40 repeat-like protein [Crassisporium funariophilum]
MYPENSAKHFLRSTRSFVDYSPPVVAPDVSARLLSCSANNVAYFTRGNRIHYKNMSTSEDVGQLCKLQDSRGDLRAIECGGLEQPDIVALGTTKGYVQIWDLQAKKMTMNWTTTKGISAMKWNGPVLTIGGMKGTIRFYDIRINPTTKMKEQTRKVTRHQAQITSLDWNVDGRYLASGDALGTVYCWEPGQKVPLDVGEFIQRRKKIQHVGAISSLVWCPWQPRLLATACTKGVIRLWNINPKTPHCNATTPGKLETGAAITGLHWSPQCKEILTTHGAIIPDPTPGDPFALPKPNVANSISVYSYPTFRHVTTLPISDKAIGDSVLNAHGTKIIFAIPEEGKLNICDAWSKRREIKKQQSFLSSTIR